MHSKPFEQRQEGGFVSAAEHSSLVSLLSSTVQRRAESILPCVHLDRTT